MINVLRYSTKASLKEMMLPGLLTIGFPIVCTLVGKLVYQGKICWLQKC